MRRIFLIALPLAFIILLSFKTNYSFKVSGKVTDENGSPVAGATVSEKGTKNAVNTGKDGSFTLMVSSEKAILVISFVGYDVKEVSVKGKSVINASITPAQQSLNEVVVTTAYSKQKRRDLTGSVASVNGYADISGNYAASPGYYYKTDDEEFNTEDYDNISENRFLKVSDNPLSTFSIDVDAASYSNVRRFINTGQLPPAGAVRIEEMVNYFHYNYPQPKNKDPFTVTTEISACPWNKDHQLVMIGLQGKKIPTDDLPSSNLTFLVDVSGSMQSPNKLPLVKQSLKMLTEQLRENDMVSIVVYAGAAGLVLPPTSGDDKETITEAIDRLEAGGSTAGGAGIKLAYKTAEKNFMKNGNNRVILCTDGDFNVGASSDDDMERLIEKERETGVYLTVLGYGMGNYKDNKMQKLADKGNGNHAYIDGLNEAKKVLVNEFGGTLFTIAKDVKLQLEFNPAKVQGYRLIGYENRMLAKEDFNDDKKDAGELGSGHTVTALYEVIPAGIKDTFLTKVDDLKYQSKKKEEPKENFSNEILTVKLRYKAPGGSESRLIEHPVMDQRVPFSETSDNFRFATSVAEFGMLLRNSPFKSSSSYDDVISTARKAKGNDAEGYRREFVKLAEKAKRMAGGQKLTAIEEDEEDGTY